jgi:multiple sugar transport system substrate-binding protein
VKRIAVTSVAALALLAAACAPGGKSNEDAAPAPAAVKPTGTVTFWHFFVDREAAAIEAVVKEFEAKNPGVKVKVVGGQDDDKMRQAISAGKGPDVGLSYSTDIVGNFCQTGAWRNLKSYIDRDKVDLEKLLPIVRTYTEYNRIRCAMPMLADTYGLFYNKKMLAEAGYNAPPKTLSELETMTQKLTKRKPDGTIQVAGFVPLMDYYENQPAHLAPSWGARFLNGEGKSNIGTDPAWKEMLNWQKKFIDSIGYPALNKFNATKGEEFSAAHDFHRGRVAMILDGEYRVAFLKAQAPSLDYATAPFPVPDDKQDRYGAGYVTGNIMGISKGAKNPEAAWALIKYLTLDTDALVKLSNGLKNVPTTQDSLNSPALDVDDRFKTFIDLLQNANSDTSPSTANGGVYQITFQDWITGWAAGKVRDLDAGLKQVDKDVDNALKLGTGP